MLPEALERKLAFLKEILNNREKLTLNKKILQNRKISYSVSHLDFIINEDLLTSHIILNIKTQYKKSSQILMLTLLKKNTFPKGWIKSAC